MAETITPDDDRLPDDDEDERADANPLRKVHRSAPLAKRRAPSDPLGGRSPADDEEPLAK